MHITNPDFVLVLACDLGVLLACAMALIVHGQLSAFHPATTYLFYHIWSVTLRLVALTSGSHAGLGNVLSEPPSPGEIIRAAYAYDLALVAVTLIWLYLARRERGKVLEGRESYGLQWTIRLTVSYFRRVAVLSIAAGLYSLWYLRFAGSGVVGEHIANLGAWSNSTWVTMTRSWAVQGFAMLHYIVGFSPFLTALTAVAFIMAALDTARYVVVVWLLFCCFAYLSRSRRRWPPLSISLVLVLVAAAWFPLKAAVASYWAGDDLMTIVAKSERYTEVALSPRGNGGDTTFLDQSALYMALSDRRGSYFYGTTLLPLIALPVPRPWWPNKPTPVDYAIQISTPERPVGEFGMVPGLVGEGYVNFGYFGVVLFPVVAAYLFGAGYFRAMRYPHQSVERFAYLVCACVLIQVFRDGLVSIVMFTLVNAMPMTFVIYAHWLFAARWRVRQVGEVAPGWRVA